ncbi:MAG: helix-turn-helix transcriptional regulator [Planctomycetota bacterium]|jgi:AraC-like DNA-binding protein
MELIEAARFSVTEAGGRLVEQDWNHDQFNPFYKVYLITDGEGEVTAGSQVLRLRPGHLYLIPSHISLQMRCEHSMYHYWFHILVELQRGVDLLSLVHPSLELIPPDLSALEAQMGRIAELYPADCPSHEMEIQGLVRLVLTRFIVDEEAGGSLLNAEEVAIFQPTLEYINEHLASPLSNEELAALHHWHPTYFANRFARAIGTPPRHYILRRRIARSQVLLTTGTQPIAEIASAVGFHDPYYFSRAFKKVSGIPPRRYRSQAIHG